MKTIVEFLFGSILGFFVVAGMIIAASWGGLQLYKWLGPQREEVRREVFENTPSYIRGKQQRLTDLCLEYEISDDEHQGALRTVILQESEELRGNEFKMSDYVRDCINKMETRGEDE